MHPMLLGQEIMFPFQPLVLPLDRVEANVLLPFLLP